MYPRIGEPSSPPWARAMRTRVPGLAMWSRKDASSSSSRMKRATSSAGIWGGTAMGKVLAAKAASSAASARSPGR